MNAELNIQLRLLLDQVQGDAQKAAEIIKRTLGGSMGAGAPGATAPQRQGAAEKDALRARMVDMRTLKDKESFYKNMSMLAGPIFSPGGGLSTMFAARQVFTALRTEEGKKRQQGMGLGTGIAGSAVGTAALIAGATAAGLALKALQSTVEGVSGAFSRGHARYSGAAQGGLGVATFQRMQSASSVLGVAPSEVMRFGNAMSFVSKELQKANSILTSSSKPLFDTQVQIKMLFVELQAMFAKLAIEMKPEIDGFIDMLRELVQFITENAKKVADAVKFVYAYNPLTQWAKLWQRIGSYSAGGGFNTLPSAKGEKYRSLYMAPQIKQLPASTWERMGLILGGIGSTNYAQQTAEATKRSAKFLEHIAKGHFNAPSPFQPIPSTP